MIYVFVTTLSLIFFNLLLRRPLGIFFAVCGPICLGSFLMVSNIGIRSFDISTKTAIIYLYFIFCLFLADFLSLPKSVIKQNDNNYFPFLLIIGLLGIGILGFCLKFIYHLQQGNMHFSQLFMFDNELVSRLFSSKFSTMHYVGYLGMIYAIQSWKSLKKSERIYVLLSLMFFLITLILLQKKVQITLGLMVLFWTYYLTKDEIKSSIIFLFSIISIGLLFTFLDNYRMSENSDTSVKFVIYYLGGSIVNLDNFLFEVINYNFRLGKEFFYALFSAGAKIFPYDISPPQKIWFAVSEGGKLLNTGTILKPIFLSFGIYGGLIFIPILTFSLGLIQFAYYSHQNIRKYVLPLYICCLSGLSIAFIGNGLIRTEWIVLIFLNLIIILYLQYLDVLKKSVKNYLKK